MFYPRLLSRILKLQGTPFKACVKPIVLLSCRQLLGGSRHYYSTTNIFQTVVNNQEIEKDQYFQHCNDLIVASEYKKLQNEFSSGKIFEKFGAEISRPMKIIHRVAFVNHDVKLGLRLFQQYFPQELREKLSPNDRFLLIEFELPLLLFCKKFSVIYGERYPEIMELVGTIGKTPDQIINSLTKVLQAMMVKQRFLRAKQFFLGIIAENYVTEKQLTILFKIFMQFPIQPTKINELLELIYNKASFPFSPELTVSVLRYHRATMNLEQYHELYEKYGSKLLPYQQVMLKIDNEVLSLIRERDLITLYDNNTKIVNKKIAEQSLTIFKLIHQFLVTLSNEPRVNPEKKLAIRQHFLVTLCSTFAKKYYFKDLMKVRRIMNTEPLTTSQEKLFNQNLGYYFLVTRQFETHILFLREVVAKNGYQVLSKEDISQLIQNYKKTFRSRKFFLGSPKYREYRKIKDLLESFEMIYYPSKAKDYDRIISILDKGFLPEVNNFVACLHQQIYQQDISKVTMLVEFFKKLKGQYSFGTKLFLMKFQIFQYLRNLEAAGKLKMILGPAFTKFEKGKGVNQFNFNDVELRFTKQETLADDDNDTIPEFQNQVKQELEKMLAGFLEKNKSTLTLLGKVEVGLFARSLKLYEMSAEIMESCYTMMIARQASVVEGVDAKKGVDDPDKFMIQNILREKIYSTLLIDYKYLLDPKKFLETLKRVTKDAHLRVSPKFAYRISTELKHYVKLKNWQYRKDYGILMTYRYIEKFDDLLLADIKDTLARLRLVKLSEEQRFELVDDFEQVKLFVGKCYRYQQMLQARAKNEILYREKYSNLLMDMVTEWSKLQRLDKMEVLRGEELGNKVLQEESGYPEKEEEYEL
ncbi:hypothetical protein DASC09_045600 [Saccharomycopsis crataegensis]|uniref:Uncharacterized protein n=1 Tax=Saccharomycopsis crataegensis TaxID=43959 RepID=A0AAV5QSG9_9ASCO|nr:hypothetical protein DASC09_045600 [Saccharomycopsis crataegensis]